LAVMKVTTGGGVAVAGSPKSFWAELRPRCRRVGKGALVPCPRSLSIIKNAWARFALPTLRSSLRREIRHYRIQHRKSAARHAQTPRRINRNRAFFAQQCDALRI